MVVCSCLCGVAFADIVGSFFDMAVLQRVRAATVVKYVCCTPSLAGDYGLAYFTDNISLTTVWLVKSKELPYWRADISIFIDYFLARCGRLLIFHIPQHAVSVNTRQWDGATKLDTVTWLAISVSLHTLLVPEDECLCLCNQPCFATSGSKRS